MVRAFADAAKAGLDFFERPYIGAEFEAVTPQIAESLGMDQIRRWRVDFQPERVVPYATAEEKIGGTTITADGAAFRSRKNWYGLKFKCQLARDGESVIGFEFLVGDPVAREKWNELGLPAVH